MKKSYKNKKILVYGAGAVGCYYGGMLVKNGLDVTFIARGEHLKTLQKQGLTLIRGNQTEVIEINATNSTKGLGIFDYIFICVKSNGTKEALESIKNNVGENTTIASFQNGIENEDLIVSAYGKEKTIGALVFVAANVVEPGKVYQFGYNGVLIGELDKTKTDRIYEIQKMFTDAGVNCPISSDINGDLWNKLVWNASFNPVSVVYELSVDKILSDTKLKKLITDIMTEVKNVALALGYNIRKDTVEFNLERSKGFTGFKTSMLQDYERGRQLETDAIIGVVLEKGKEAKVPTPQTEKIYKELMKKIEPAKTN